MLVKKNEATVFFSCRLIPALKPLTNKSKWHPLTAMMATRITAGRNRSNLAASQQRWASRCVAAAATGAACNKYSMLA
jgi:hypothetical protein